MRLFIELYSGTLRDVIESRTVQGRRFTKREIVDWAFQVSKGLNYLHSKSIIHRDLKVRLLKLLFICYLSFIIYYLLFPPFPSFLSFLVFFNIQILLLLTPPATRHQSDNVFVTWDGQKNPKSMHIGDFDVSKMVEKGKISFTQNVGTRTATAHTRSLGSEISFRSNFILHLLISGLRTRQRGSSRRRS